MVSGKRSWVGVIALVLAVPTFVNVAAVATHSVGVSITLPRFWTATPAVAVLDGGLIVLLYAALGLLTLGRRGWWTFVLAAALVGLNYLGSLALMQLDLPASLQAAPLLVTWVGVASVACFAAGLIATGVVGPWVGWIAFACAGLRAVSNLLRVAVAGAATLPGLVGASASICFEVVLLAAGVQLLTGSQRNARFEQALPADGVRFEQQGDGSIHR